MREDLSLSLLRRGYDALPSFWDSVPTAAGSWRELAPTTLFGRQAFVLRGEHAVRLFYDEDVVQRDGVVPRPLADLLFGPGAVHGLDGEAHVGRKHMFLDALTHDHVQDLGDLVARRLHQSADGWHRRAPFSLYGELVRIYGTAVIEWAGIHESGKDAARLSLRMAEVVDGFGFALPAYALGWRSRLQLNRWAARVVAEARGGRRPVPPRGILHELVRGQGTSLTPDVAGVELLNVLRPTVAVAWLGTFAALALLDHPGLGADLAREDGQQERRAFAQEVRRLTPFVPALAGRVCRPVTWQGHELERGALLVLDVPGTNRDPRRWKHPEEFRPQRFFEREPNAYDLVPQGGGPAGGHRCPGEDVALILLDRTLRQLGRTEFAVRTGPARRDRMPTLPARGIEITEARPLDGSFLALVDN